MCPCYSVVLTARNSTLIIGRWFPPSRSVSYRVRTRRDHDGNHRSQDVGSRRRQPEHSDGGACAQADQSAKQAAHEFEAYQAECEAKAAAGMAAMHTSGGTGADTSTHRQPPVPPASPPPMPTPPDAGWADPAQRTATSAARRAAARWPPPLQRSASAEERLPPQPTLTLTLTATL